MPITVTVTDADNVKESKSITESVGSHSDYSIGTVQYQLNKPKMEVVCIIDVCQKRFLDQRQIALESIKLACQLVGAHLQQIQVCFICYKMFIEII